ncbi:MAG: hypothetical protein ACI4FW_05715 [Bariatricus sp.]
MNFTQRLITDFEDDADRRDISIYARCVAIVDVFDALVSHRCYKSA